MSRLFEGKVALVTGGNFGIGKATAIKFTQEGAQVAIAARRVEEGEQTIKEICQTGGEALFVKTDVAQAVEVEALMH
jgi:NAD(P)-dependent dehydrogenase (short-subunit alcohol dehydrogenase family)